MKVSHILFSGLGGHSSVVFSCIKADFNKDFEHSLIFYGIESLLYSHTENADNLNLPYANISKKKGLDMLSWHRVYRELKNKRPDVVLLHSISLIIPVYLYAIFYKKRVIGIEHTSINVKRRVEHIFSYIAGLLCDKIVLLSRESKRDYLKKYKLNRHKKLTIIPNGIEIDTFKKTKPHREADYFRISMISRFSTQKDHRTLILALKELDNVKLTIAGTGDTWNDINAFIKEHNLQDKAHLCGLLDENELILLLRDTDIYVHASFGETLPTSILQAMSCELAVIGSNIAGINNLIDNEKNGILYENKNVPELTSKLKMLIEDKELRSKLGLNARKKIEKNYSNLLMYSSYKKLIHII